MKNVQTDLILFLLLFKYFCVFIAITVIIFKDKESLLYHSMQSHLNAFLPEMNEIAVAFSNQYGITVTFTYSRFTGKNESL